MYLEIRDVKKSYGQDGSYVQGLKGVNTGVEKGQMCVIQGTSGSGKSTLLNCIGGLDVMDSGSIKVEGTEVFGMKGDALSDYRRDNLGFIFQFYNLVQNLSVEDNILLPVKMAGKKVDGCREKLEEILEITGLAEKRKNKPAACKMPPVML